MKKESKMINQSVGYHKMHNLLSDAGVLKREDFSLSQTTDASICKNKNIK